ncbi:soma ferritin-like [Rhopilema esculentum]|uniref:soma ferritin-like n=1 Tax=Rhopilema esculentum TaxID=499914 RepID=UPI0031E0F645|eukprot:gene17712-9373_t
MSTIKQNFHAECESAISKQINSELASSYFYMALAYHFDRDDVALENFHKYFCKFSNNKRENAQKLLKYMNERGGRVKLVDIGTPANNFGEPLSIMQAVLEHERKVNDSLLDLTHLAEKHNDEQLCDFMEDHFLNPEVELLKQVGDHVTNLKRVGDGLGVYMFERETLEH